MSCHTSPRSATAVQTAIKVFMAADIELDLTSVRFQPQTKVFSVSAVVVASLCFDCNVCVLFVGLVWTRPPKIDTERGLLGAELTPD